MHLELLSPIRDPYLQLCTSVHFCTDLSSKSGPDLFVFPASPLMSTFHNSMEVVTHSFYKTLVLPVASPPVRSSVGVEKGQKKNNQSSSTS